MPQIPAYIVLYNWHSLWDQSEEIKNVYKNFEISNQEVKFLTFKLLGSIFKGKGHKQVSKQNLKKYVYYFGEFCI